MGQKKKHLIFGILTEFQVFLAHIFVKIGGGCGIRTHVGVNPNGFQVRLIKIPLRFLSVHFIRFWFPKSKSPSRFSAPKSPIRTQNDTVRNEMKNLTSRQNLPILRELGENFEPKCMKRFKLTFLKKSAKFSKPNRTKKFFEKFSKRKKPYHTRIFQFLHILFEPRSG